MAFMFVRSPHRGHRIAVPLVALFAVLAAVGVNPLGRAAAADTGAPTITRAPAGSHGFPFMSVASDIAGTGYVQQEFFLSGTATAYKKSGTFGSDGKWRVTPGSRAPYKTRILTARPRDPAEFNGTVVVEWFNVSGQIDVPADWVTMRNELVRSGYAYVGVSAQKAGIDGGLPFFPALKAWDPDRYGTLSHPGDQYSYDIFSQAGQALRNPHGPNPLGNLKPARLIAVGESQSAIRLTTYVDAVAPVARAYDGYLIHSNMAAPSPLEDFPGDTSMPSSARIRTDLTAPTFLAETETDVPLHLAARQPDSPSVHTWELAGTAHADKWLLDGSMALADHSYGVTLPATDCLSPYAPANDGPGHYGVSAALAALNRWIRDGAQPAAAPNITVANGLPARAAGTGIALGGVRLPDVTVPTRTLSGQRSFTDLGALCSLFGASDPWNGDSDVWDEHNADDPSDPAGKLTGEPQLGELYPTHAAYVDKVEAAANAAEQAGFLTPGDAATIVATARNSPIGR